MRDLVIQAIKAGHHRNKDLRAFTGLAHDKLENILLAMRDENIVETRGRGRWFMTSDYDSGRLTY